MEVIIHAVVYTLLVVAIVYLGFRNVVLRRRVVDEIANKLQALVDKSIYMEQYHEALQQIENSKLEKSDDFIKFLSDSRNAAFDYIEQTQEALSQFDKVMTDVIKWSEGVGMAMGYNTPHANRIREISEAYSKLKELLPENKQTPNN